MLLSNIQFLALSISLFFLIAQLLVKEKKTAHILFALFCASIAITVAKKMSGDVVGAYQNLIGMAACLTCNGYWLLARSLFREKNPILPQHLIFAGAIALLIMANQGYLFVTQAGIANLSDESFTRYIIVELTVLLSSSVLVLSFWEGCRGFKADDTKGKAQRLLFLFTFGFAVAISKVSNGLLASNAEAQAMVTTMIILMVLINTQVLMLWRLKKKDASVINTENSSHTTGSNNLPCDAEAHDRCPTEQALADKVQALLVEHSFYLKANLRVVDIARELDVPEYKVSKVLRNYLSAKNFNQYINELRIKHAKDLLTDSSKQKWSVLVIGLESGFASVGPFTRTFKALTGFTPNQYRQSLQN